MYQKIISNFIIGLQLFNLSYAYAGNNSNSKFTEKLFRLSYKKVFSEIKDFNSKLTPESDEVVFYEYSDMLEEVYYKFSRLKERLLESNVIEDKVRDSYLHKLNGVFLALNMQLQALENNEKIEKIIQNHHDMIDVYSIKDSFFTKAKNFLYRYRWAIGAAVVFVSLVVAFFLTGKSDFERDKESVEGIQPPDPTTAYFIDVLDPSTTSKKIVDSVREHYINSLEYKHNNSAEFDKNVKRLKKLYSEIMGKTKYSRIQVKKPNMKDPEGGVFISYQMDKVKDFPTKKFQKFINKLRKEKLFLPKIYPGAIGYEDFFGRENFFITFIPIDKEKNELNPHDHLVKLLNLSSVLKKRIEVYKKNIINPYVNSVENAEVDVTRFKKDIGLSETKMTLMLPARKKVRAYYGFVLHFNNDDKDLLIKNKKQYLNLVEKLNQKGFTPIKDVNEEMALQHLWDPNKKMSKYYTSIVFKWKEFGDKIEKFMAETYKEENKVLLDKLIEDRNKIKEKIQKIKKEMIAKELNLDPVKKEIKKVKDKINDKTPRINTLKKILDEEYKSSSRKDTFTNPHLVKRFKEIIIREILNSKDKSFKEENPQYKKLLNGDCISNIASLHISYKTHSEDVRKQFISSFSYLLELEVKMEGLKKDLKKLQKPFLELKKAKLALWVHEEKLKYIEEKINSID